MESFKNKKIIILQDYFLYKGGGERSMMELAKAFNADIATSFVSQDAFDPRDHGIKTIELTTEGKKSHIPGWRFLKVQFSFLFKTKFLKEYDIIIYSGDCLSAVHNAKGKLNVAYIHTPPRHLFDNYQIRLDEYKGLKRLIFRPYAWVSRWRYKRAIPKMELLLTNSKTVQKRIKKYLNKDSKVIYPPGDSLCFKWIGQGNYYFSWARLYDVKRVDKIVEAFTKMPNKKLIVASGGPELEKIKSIAKGHKNITILNWITDKQLLDLLGNCIATIYVPLNEDFGMSPVESMMAGKPVVGVDEGGLRETIINNKTGILIKPNFNIQDIVEAVEELTSEKALNMKESCQNQAKKFSVKEFVRGIKESIESLV